MLSRRIIPCLDVKGGRVVKGVRFRDHRDAGDPVELARFYDEQGADELVFYDITASSDGRAIMLDVVRRVAEEVYIPLTVGGGVRTVEDVRTMLNAGADKVSINTAAVQNPELIREAAALFGNQCIVLGMDARRIDPTASPHSATSPHSGAPTRHSRESGNLSPLPEIAIDDSTRWEVRTHTGADGGRATGIDALKWTQYAAQLGAGEVVLNSIDADGTKAGYDLELTRAVADAVSIPVIASGGAGNVVHMCEAVTQGGADAALAASIFHYGEFTIAQAKDYMRSQNVPVRLTPGTIG